MSLGTQKVVGLLIGVLIYAAVMLLTSWLIGPPWAPFTRKPRARRARKEGGK